jgi:hypothetical protein
MTTRPVMRLMNQTVTIARPSVSRTPDGGTASALVPHAVVRGAWRPAGTRERESGARVDLAFDRVVYLPFGSDVERGDRLTVQGSPGVHRVVDVRNPGGRDNHLEVYARTEQGAS